MVVGQIMSHFCCKLGHRFAKNTVSRVRPNGRGWYGDMNLTHLHLKLCIFRTMKECLNASDILKSLLCSIISLHKRDTKFTFCSIVLHIPVMDIVRSLAMNCNGVVISGSLSTIQSGRIDFIAVKNLYSSSFFQCGTVDL